MKGNRVGHGARIVPSNRRISIESWRRSWSSASPVSTIYTQSPEPPKEEPAIRESPKEIPPTSIITKKTMITVGIVVGCFVCVAIILSVVLPLKLNSSSSATNTPIGSLTTLTTSKR